MTQPEITDCYLCLRKNRMRAIRVPGEALSPKTEYQCKSCSTIGQPFLKNEPGGEDMKEETCVAPKNMRCPNCNSGQFNPLNRPEHQPKVHTLWQCSECKKFFQPFLSVSLTPTTVWDIPCHSCRQHGFINGADSEDKNVRDETALTEDKDDDITIIECVHCHKIYAYCIRCACKTLFPKIPD